MTSFPNAVLHLKEALDEKIARVVDATPPTLAVFIDSDQSLDEPNPTVVVAQAKGFELHDLMHEHVVEEGDGAVMSQLCGCCSIPATGSEVFIKRIPQSCVDLRVIIAGDKACGKTTLMANLLASISNSSTTKVLQQLRFHKVCFANMWVDPSSEEIELMANELRDEGSTYARTLPLMATQLAVGMMHIDASELSYFLQDELPFGEKDVSSSDQALSSSFPECRDVEGVQAALARLRLKDRSPPQDAVVRLMELGGDVIDELRGWVHRKCEPQGGANVGRSRTRLREWILRQLAGAVGENPPLQSEQEVEYDDENGKPTSLCYFVNPSVSLSGDLEAVRELVVRLGFLVACTSGSQGESIRTVHLFIAGNKHSPTYMTILERNLDVLLHAHDSTVASETTSRDLLWDEKLEILVKSEAERLAEGRVHVTFSVVPHWTDFFSSGTGIAMPNIDAMLSFLRMVILRHAAVLPRIVVSRATLRAVESVRAHLGGNVPNKELFAEILLNPHSAHKSSAREKQMATRKAQQILAAHCSVGELELARRLDVLPLSEITDMLSWLPPMLLVDSYDEAIARSNPHSEQL